MTALKVLVTTDNHVGYNEQDPIRGDDAARTFDEIMEIAKDGEVDFVIQAGDLFHINRPSKRSMYKVMRALRKNCLGDKPVEFEVVNHGPLSLDGEFDHVNFEDPNFNVAIPVFAISGNHDDSGGSALLAPMDLLSMAGLVNHFGSVVDNEDIVVHPILIKKGTTKLALYGIANVRDERLHRSFRSGKVRFLRPQEDPGSWFNILCVHQNHFAHSQTNYLPEHFLPSFMHLVIWGHEHESLYDPVTNPTTGFQVIQPGSSVATALSEGETVQKHIVILNIEGTSFTSDPVPLKSVRPFFMDSVVLADSKIPPARDSRQQLTKWLTAKVDGLIAQANEDWNALNESAGSDEVPPLPLIRLRVDYTGGYDVENPTRFSNRFVGRVANANDVVQYYKKNRRANGTGDSASRAGDAAATGFNSDPDHIQLTELVHQFLEKQKLLVLPQRGMIDAISSYVDKDDKGALKQFVDEALTKKVEDLVGSLDSTSLSTNAISGRQPPSSAMPRTAPSGRVAAEPRVSAQAGTAPTSSPRTRKSARSVPVVTEDDDVEAEAISLAQSKALDRSDDSDFMDVDDSDFEEPTPPTRKSTRRAASGTRAGAKSAAKPRSIPVARKTASAVKVVQSRSSKPTKFPQKEPAKPQAEPVTIIPGKLDSDDDFE